MTSPYEAVVVLSRALDQAGDVLAAVHPDQLALPTPCQDWDVARLIAHLVATPGRFAASLRGEQPDWSHDPPATDHEWAPVFRTAADDLIHLWHQQGDATDERLADMQTAELAVHTWDLARATRQSAELDESVAHRGLAFMAAGLTPDNRGSAFDEEIEAPHDAPVYHRLAAFSGRQLDDAWLNGSA
ncbi:MAG: TIGR03086 family metal-binding protein [Nocardioides sp.]